MLVPIILGCVLILATTAIHASFMMIAIQVILPIASGPRTRIRGSMRALFVAAVILVMFLASVIETWLWATLYVAAGALDSWEEAVYFSTVTFSTLGFGDVTLEPPWRLLSAFQAVNGLILFGWTTALVYAAVEMVYGSKGEKTATSG